MKLRLRPLIFCRQCFLSGNGRRGAIFFVKHIFAQRLCQDHFLVFACTQTVCETDPRHIIFIPGVPFWPSLSSVTLMLYITVIFPTNEGKHSGSFLPTSAMTHRGFPCNPMAIFNTQRGSELQCGNLWALRHHHNLYM